MKKQILFISTVVLLQVANCLLPSISYAQKFAGGVYHSLAVCSDSTVRAWGDNFFGELGNGTNNESNVPVQVSSLTSVTAISAGSAYSLALKNDGTIWTWGNNDYGQLGNGTN